MLFFRLWIWLAVVRVDFKFVVSLADGFWACFILSVANHVKCILHCVKLYNVLNALCVIEVLRQTTFWRSFLLYRFFIACKTPWSIGWMREVVVENWTESVTWIFVFFLPPTNWTLNSWWKLKKKRKMKRNAWKLSCIFLFWNTVFIRICPVVYVLYRMK